LTVKQTLLHFAFIFSLTTWLGAGCGVKDDLMANVLIIETTTLCITL